MINVSLDDPITAREIGECLGHAMAASGVSSSVLAARINVSERTVEAWRGGKNLEKVAALFAVFEALDYKLKVVRPVPRRRRNPRTYP